jgi:hypothetical protein
LQDNETELNQNVSQVTHGNQCQDEETMRSVIALLDDHPLNRPKISLTFYEAIAVIVPVFDRSAHQRKMNNTIYSNII